MEKFNVFFKEDFIGTIGFCRETDTYKFVRNKDIVEWLPPQFSENPLLGTPKEFITCEDVKAFVEDRVYPKERQLLDMYLEALDLGCWDAWEIMVRCSGCYASDEYWIDSYGVTDYTNRTRLMRDFKYRDRKSTHEELFLF